MKEDLIIIKNTLCTIYSQCSKIIVIFIVTTIILSLIPVAQLHINKHLLDTLFNLFNHKENAIKLILFLLFIQMLASVITVVFNGIQSLYNFKITQIITLELQCNIYENCKHRKFSEFEDAIEQNKMYRMQLQSPMASSALLQSTIQLSKKIISILAFSIIIISYKYVLGLIVLIMIIPRLYVGFYAAKKNYHVLKYCSGPDRQVGYLSNILISRDYVRDNFLFSLWQYFLEKFKILKINTNKERISLQRSTTLLLMSINILDIAVCLFIYIYIVITGYHAGSLGSIVMYMSVFANLQSQAQGIADEIIKMKENSLYMRDYYDFLNNCTPSSQVPQKHSSEIKSIEFKDVSFKYHKNSKYVLNNVSFRINHPEMICIIGRNGSGKTTITKILSRLYDITSGEILINNQKLDRYTKEYISSQIGHLAQDPSKYYLTIKNNIAIGNLDKEYNEYDTMTATENAKIKDKILSLPDGEDTLLGKIFGQGEELSGGEWQKLCLARIFYRNTPILILDEPTNSLDPEMDKHMLNLISNMKKNKIIIFITHRLSYLCQADKVIYLDKGSIIGMGTHEELLSNNNSYANYVNQQSNQEFITI